MPDNRGSGRTRDDGGALSLTAMAEDCIALLDHLKIDKAHVLGHSMGGVIAMALAAAYPDRVGRLALAATAPAAPRRTVSVVDNLAALRESGVSERQWYRSFFHWLFRPSFFEDDRAVEAAIAMSRAYPYAQPVSDMRRQIEASRIFEAGGLPEKIEAETLALLGAEDLLFPPALVEPAFNGFARRRIEVIANAAHSVHWDQPAAFASAAAAFLFAPRAD